MTRFDSDFLSYSFSYYHHRYPFGDISPEACVQGPSRRDRNYAYWAYRVLLAGVEDDVSDVKDYYGYDNLTTLDGGVKSLNVKDFAAQQCNVEGVGHVGKKMWQSVSRTEASHGHLILLRD